MATPRCRRTIDSLLSRVVELLVNDKPLPPANRDHPLGGVWVGLRESTDRRFEEYRQDPDKVVTWEDAKARILSGRR